MAPRIDDHYLWLGLGVGLGISLIGIACSLRTIVTLTKVTQPAPQPRSIPLPQRSNAEDAIAITSLGNLAMSNNVRIRTAATKILCERYMRDPAQQKRLLRDLNGGDGDLRRKCLQLLRLFHAEGVRISDEALREALGEEWVSMPAEIWVADEDVGELVEDVRERIRRRRREAIVINDGDHPVNQEDVFMQGQLDALEDLGLDLRSDFDIEIAP